MKTIAIADSKHLQSQENTASIKEAATPKESTHALVFDIVNTDATVKRIEVHFCNTDHWSNSWPGALNIAEMIGAALSPMLRADKDSIGFQETIIDKRKCAPIPIHIHPCITQPEYLNKP